DPDDPTVNEASINRAGYRLLGKSKTALALDVFKINTILYPNSANVFDSYAEAYMKLGDTALAIENYEKSLSLDPENRNAQYYIDELKKSK
ncbi:MAG: tetratricopeptide repeat protein, partial [Maribacter sp.]